MIEKLTPEQEARFPEFVERWTRIGLSCEPLNDEATKDAVRRAYAVANLPPPQRFYICDSPLSGVLLAALLKKDSVRDSVGASAWDSVRASVWDSVGASVWDSVRASVWDSVRASVGASVWDSVRDSVWDSVRDSVRDSVYGAHDAPWLAFYSFFGEACGLDVSSLHPLMDIAQHCGWWIPHRDACILQHRHCELHRDADGRLHNPSGMAVKYRDGWGVYAWHGTRIPFDSAWIIEEPNRLSVASIDAEDNAEIERVMLEIFGHDRYLLESGAQPIHTDEFGELFRREMLGDEPLVMVRVTNSTPEPDGSHRRYFLRVPPSVTTAREAVAWTFGVNQYNPVVES